MTWNSLLPLLILLSSLLPGLLIFWLPDSSTRLRTWLNLFGALLKLVLVGAMLYGVYHEQIFEVRWSLAPGLELLLHADALSMLFVTLSTLLWLVTTVYAIGYLDRSPHSSRFFGFFSLCVSATVGLAMAGNLFTFVIFYELLTLSTFPLVAHNGTAKALKGAAVYLKYTLAGGLLLMLGAVWLHSLAGSIEFSAGGVLSDIPGLDPLQLQLIFLCILVGLGVKAALVPLHGWLPKAMVAPAPVSALLHAVAVVKAGAFGIVRLVYDVYGIEFSSELGLLPIIAAFAAITILYGSLKALQQDNLKRRLAYSTVSQVSYILLGTAILGPLATIGGIVHLVHQGLMKITLFFAAGNYAESARVHLVSEMNGLGKRMPWTSLAFTIGALGMIGVPPVAGFVSKWYLAMGGLEGRAEWVLPLLLGSSLLNAAYFLPILYRLWFKQPDPDTQPHHPKAALLVAPPLVTAALALAAGLLAGASYSPLSWVEIIVSREYLP